MNSPSRGMTVSPLWLQVAVLTFLIGFAILGYLAYRIHTEHPPIPAETRTTDGAHLFTGEEVMAGQHIFQKYGLMQHGTLFGHGAYLGPDFTTQYLHFATLRMAEFHAARGLSDAEARERVIEESKRNAYDPGTGVLTFTPAQVFAFERMVEFYGDWRSRTGCGVRTSPIRRKSAG